MTRNLVCQPQILGGHASTRREMAGCRRTRAGLNSRYIYISRHGRESWELFKLAAQFAIADEYVLRGVSPRSACCHLDAAHENSSASS